MITWIVAGVIIAMALVYGLIYQYVLFWTIALALIVLGIAFSATYCLNREVEKPKP